MSGIGGSTVEQAALAWFADLGYAVARRPDLAPGEPAAERATAPPAGPARRKQPKTAAPEKPKKKSARNPSRKQKRAVKGNESQLRLLP